MAQYVPPVLANGSIYNPQQLPVLPVPRPGSPAPYGGPPPHPGPVPPPVPGPSPFGYGQHPLLASLLSGHYPVHDFYGQADPKRSIQLQALLNLLAQYRA